MSEIQVDANKVINKLSKKLESANLQAVISELQIEELERQLTEARQSLGTNSGQGYSTAEVVEPTSIDEG